MYHSTMILLTDESVLVGGSNPHVVYNFIGVEFPTDLSLEAFFPPYLAAIHEVVKPRIFHFDENEYQKVFLVSFGVGKNFLKLGFCRLELWLHHLTHSFSMNQRMVVLKIVQFSCVGPSTYRIVSFGPSEAEIAPPG